MILLGEYFIHLCGEILHLDEEKFLLGEEGFHLRNTDRGPGIPGCSPSLHLGEEIFHLGEENNHLRGTDHGPGFQNVHLHFTQVKNIFT